MNTILVSVAAFREPLLEFTLDQIFRNAYSPERITVGLVDQSFDDTRAWLAHKPYAAQVRYTHVNPVDSEGVSWARAKVQESFQGETYYLQIDSHTWFAPGWDKLLIELHDAMTPHFRKPVITAYPPGFEIDADGTVTFTEFPEANVFEIVPDYAASALLPNSATLRFKTDLVPELEAMEGSHIAGGFLFACGEFVREVPYDPRMYFHGEEQNLTLRAFTRGWTIVHVRNDWIPVKHLYKQAGTAYDSHHWNAELEAQRKVKWVERNEASHARLLQLIRGELDGPWGLGGTRSLQTFVEFSGINYLQYCV